MDKITAVFGTVWLVTIGGAHAAESVHPDALQVTSYADLLEPVANAVVALKADDEAREKVQFYYYHQSPYSGYPYPPYAYRGYYYHHHHHHHHHHHEWGRFRR